MVPLNLKKPLSFSSKLNPGEREWSWQGFKFSVGQGRWFGFGHSRLPKALPKKIQAHGAQALEQEVAQLKAYEICWGKMSPYIPPNNTKFHFMSIFWSI